MKSKLLLSLVVALVFPFLLASCGGHKEPKDMTNQELMEAYKKESDKVLEKLNKCTSLDELEKVNKENESEILKLVEEFSSRSNVTDEEGDQFVGLLMETSQKYSEIENRISGR